MVQQRLFLPVASAYDRWSTFYDSYENPMVFMAAEILKRSFANVSGSSVFEFGCGTGRNLALLSSFGAREVGGCDLSEGMLKVARTRLPQARLLHADMTTRLPIPDGTLDAALFCLTLEHVADIRPPLREAIRVTGAAGRICLVEIHPFYSLEGAAAHFDHEGVEVRMPTHAHQFEDYLQAFEELGLAVRSCREWKPDDVGNPAELQQLKRGPSVPLTVEFWLERRS